MTSTINGAHKAIGVADAAKYLGISHYKITRFIKRGIIKAYKDLNDERHKLIKISDLDHLKKQLESPVGEEEKASDISAAA